ncbi:MAG: hypothetical protein ACOYOV_06385 [Bacteroidales bacterium]
MTKENLEELKKRLPAKWAKHLSVTTGFAKVTILKVMSGEYENDKIFDAAIALVEEYEKNNMMRQSKIDTICNSPTE